MESVARKHLPHTLQDSCIFHEYNSTRRVGEDLSLAVFELHFAPRSVFVIPTAKLQLKFLERLPREYRILQPIDHIQMDTRLVKDKVRKVGGRELTSLLRSATQVLTMHCLLGQT